PRRPRRGPARGGAARPRPACVPRGRHTPYTHDARSRAAPSAARGASARAALGRRSGRAAPAAVHDEVRAQARARHDADRACVVAGFDRARLQGAGHARLAAAGRARLSRQAVAAPDPQHARLRTGKVAVQGNVPIPGAGRRIEHHAQDHRPASPHHLLLRGSGPRQRLRPARVALENRPGNDPL
ncbi:MAG: hypothetical protein AVDCRST_MAG67-2546, partial [uncultured Solirubrobacteraceae bacterium]